MAKRQSSISEITILLNGKQAEKVFNDLTQQLDRLNAEKSKLESMDLISQEERNRLESINKEIKETTSSIRRFRKQVIDVGEVIRNVSSTSESDLRKAYNQLTRQGKQLQRNTAEYATNLKQRKLLKAEIDKTNISAEKQLSIFDKTNISLKKFGTAFLAYVGSDMIIRGLRKMYDMNVALSDQLSDIEKTTGITGSELAALSEDINRIDTRTSVEQLNNLAVAAGKLGITGKENVLGFVKAGNMINVALGEDLGEDAIKNIAKLNDVLGITKELGVEKGLLATGSAINELGQSSTASEAYLVDFAQRLGGIASQARLTIQQVLALGSAADQMGQNVEVSATALSKMITTIVSKTGQVAKAIGVTKEELQGLLDKSTWDALLFVFEKLAGKGGLAAIAPLMGDLGSDGARLTQVISALASNTSKLNREIEISNKAFREGTSVINEYEKKNSNLAGTMEKIGKNIKNRFMDSKFVEWLNNVAIGIEEVTRGLGDLNEQFKNQSELFVKTYTETSSLYDEYKKLQNPKTAEEQERLNEVIKELGKNVPSAVTAFDQYGVALDISGQRTETFIRLQKERLENINDQLRKKTEKEIQTTKEQLAVLNSLRDEEGNFYEKEQTGMTGITVTAKITDEKAIAKRIQEISKLQLELTSLNKSLEEINTFDPQRIIDDSEAQKHIRRINAEIAQRKKTEQQVAQETEEERKARLKAEKELIDKQLKDIDIWLQQQKNALTEAYNDKTEYNGKLISDDLSYNKEIENLTLESLNKRLAILGLEPEQIAKIRGQILDIRKKMAEDALKIQEEINKILLEADPVKKEQKEYEDRLKKLDLYGVDRYNMTKEQLEALELLEQQHQNNLDDIARKTRAKNQKRAEERYKQTKSYQNKNSAELDLENEQSQLSQMVELGAYSEQKAFDIQMNIHKKRLGLLYEELEARKEVGAKTDSVLSDIVKAEKNAADDLIKNFVRKRDLYKQYGADLGDAFGSILAGQEGAMADFGDSLIDIMFDVLSKMVNVWALELAGVSVKTIAQAQMESLATPDSVLTFGASGLARAAVMAGLITTVLAAAKTGLKAVIKGGKTSDKSSSSSTGQRVVKGYSVGGYSGDGGTHEVAGVVHKGEYIVPAFQMKDPVSFNYVRALETIRQTRTQANPLPRAGYAEGGPVQSTVPVFAASDPELGNTLKQINVFLQKLDTKQFTTVLNVSRLNDFQNRFSASVARGSRKKSEKSK